MKSRKLLRSDLIRKELAGAAESAEFNQGIYSEEWTERTYAELLNRCEAELQITASPPLRRPIRYPASLATRRRGRLRSKCG